MRVESFSCLGSWPACFLIFYIIVGSTFPHFFSPLSPFSRAVRSLFRVGRGKPMQKTVKRASWLISFSRYSQETKLLVVEQRWICTEFSVLLPWWMERGTRSCSSLIRFLPANQPTIWVFLDASRPMRVTRPAENRKTEGVTSSRQNHLYTSDAVVNSFSAA